MFCRNCGKQLQDGDRFCFGCGAMQDVAPVPVEPAPVVETLPYNPMTTESALMGASVTEKPRKKNSKKKKVLVITSIVTALALVLGVVGWFWLSGGKEVIYVRSEARTYNMAGELCTLKTWEYDDCGMMLRYEMDNGAPNAVWDSEDMVYISVPGAVDGEIDNYLAYEYDDHGNVERVKYIYSSDDYDRNYRYKWKYEDDRIVSVLMKDESDSQLKGADTEYLYSCDEDGNPTHIYYEGSAGDIYRYKMAYDEEGCMTRLIRCDLEGDIVFDMAYDQEGRVEEYIVSRRPSTSMSDDVDGEGDEWYSADVEYSDDGLLLSFGDDYEYEYDGDRLVKKVAGEDEYAFNYNGDVPEDEDGNLIYDKNGCLSRVNHDDGTYTEYEYLKLELSEEDALRHRRQQQAFFSGTDMDWLSLSYYDPLALTLPVPVNPRLLVWPVTEYKR